jgi:hypothetical protein
MRRGKLWFAPLLFVSALAMVPGSGPAAGSDLETCLAEPLPPKQIACLAKAAIAARDPEICLQAEQPAVRWPCVALFADQADDPSLCQILPASEGVPASVSQDLCHVHLAISRRDSMLCDGLIPSLDDTDS